MSDRDIDDHRLHSPAAERNRGPILAELLRLLPPQGVALEVASGSGQHAAHFAAALSGWTWQPTDADADAQRSIRAWCAGLANARDPLPLDVLDDAHWAALPEPVDAVFCANMVHISPWATSAALMRGASRLLAPRGLLLLYGPFLVDGEPTAPSNLAFDADLRRRDPRWGLRRLSDVLDEAAHAGLSLRERITMPANNLLLVMQRGPTGPAA